MSDFFGMFWSLDVRVVNVFVIVIDVDVFGYYVDVIFLIIDDIII